MYKKVHAAAHAVRLFPSTKALLNQRLKQRCGFREVVWIGVQPKGGSSWPRDGGVEQAVVADLGNLTDGCGAGSQHIVAIKVFGHAKRRLSSAER